MLMKGRLLLFLTIFVNGFGEWRSDDEEFHEFRTKIELFNRECSFAFSALWHRTCSFQVISSLSHIFFWQWNLMCCDKESSRRRKWREWKKRTINSQSLSKIPSFGNLISSRLHDVNCKRLWKRFARSIKNLAKSATPDKLITNEITLNVRRIK